MSMLAQDSSTPDTLESLHSDLEAASLDGLWRIEKELLTPEPVGTGEPYVWPWETVEPFLRRAGHLVSPGSGGDRRVVRLINPTLDAPAGATHTISAAFQYLLSGETAPMHRHSPAAIRFVVSGGGAFTEVQGRTIEMETGDLILTPNWTWHGHRSRSASPVTWLDAIDSPLVLRLKAMFFEPGVREEPGSDAMSGYTLAGTSPIIFATDLGAEPERPAGGAWPLVYRWRDIEPILKEGGATRTECDGDLLYYANPANRSRDTLPTIGCAVQRLHAGERTKGHRHVSSTVYHVVSGSGSSLIGNSVSRWKQGDVFTVPTWATHSHAADDESDAILFSLTDRPVMEALKLYREEIVDLS